MKWYAQVHFDKERFNHAFAEHIAGLGEEHNGWHVTVLYYSVIHLIEAYLFDQRKSGTKTHVERGVALRRLSVLKSISVPYDRMEELSRVARYGTAAIAEHEVARAVKDHATIYDHIAELLGESALHPPIEVEEGEVGAEGELSSLFEGRGWNEICAIACRTTPGRGCAVFVFWLAIGRGVGGGGETVP